MRSLITFSFIFLFALACKEKEINKSNKIRHENELIETLNDGDGDKALEIAERNASKASIDETKLSKASAYALKGGLDIYALYGILELKLFNRPLAFSLESEQVNPFKRYAKNLEPEEILQESLATIEEEIAMGEYHFKELSIEGIRKELQPVIEHNLTRSQAEALARTLSKNLKEKYHQIRGETGNDLEALAEMINELSRKRELSGMLKDSSEEANKILEETALAKESLLKTLWEVFEALPVIDSIPNISLKNEEHLFSAMNLLASIEKSSPQSKDAKQHLTIITTALFFNHLRGLVSFTGDLGAVDFLCQFMTGDFNPKVNESMARNLKFIRIAYADTPEKAKVIESIINDMKRFMKEGGSKVKLQGLSSILGQKEIDALKVFCQ